MTRHEAAQVWEEAHGRSVARWKGVCCYAYGKSRRLVRFKTWYHLAQCAITLELAMVEAGLRCRLALSR